ncbi:hypothetical protein [Chelatococcus reniformis]|uniref:Uncharacterized protein n=1 Tax=Chelatococcus reniformis TaxID=1494448 RepID=A0A916XFG8_9HYPH|nr:hypothetical protein [Chelatococcus reniformis]GGC68294.1 hypothetical protein GCM10010994_28600 [Chelatococcus reniformis]
MSGPPVVVLPDELTPERIEQAMVFMAYVVMRYGDQYAPILERLEQELADARRRETPRSRAERLLKAYTLDGGSKAIR